MLNKKIKILLILIGIFIASGLIFITFFSGNINNNKTFIFTSKDFLDGEKLSSKHEYNSFGCSGDNLSPAFDISGVPEGTISLALTVYDPDANTGSGFWHWIVYNIDPSVNQIVSGIGSEKKHDLGKNGLQAVNDFGSIGYDGACPPQGDKPHRYIYTLYALNKKLDLPPETSNAVIRFMINSSTIDKVSLTGLYGR